MEVQIPEILDQNSNHKGQFECDFFAGPEIGRFKGNKFHYET